MNSAPVPEQPPRGLGTTLRIREIADYRKLTGKRVCVDDIVGVVKDLSDTGQHLVLVKDSPAGEEVRIPLSTIQLIEVLDDDPSLTKELRTNRLSAIATLRAAATDQVYTQQSGASSPKRQSSRGRKPRKAAVASLPPRPAPLRVLYDPITDSLYIRLCQSQRSASKAITPNTTLDFDAQNHPVGIEVTQATKQLGYEKPVLVNLRFKLEFDEKTDCLHLLLPGTNGQTNIAGNEGVSFDHDEDGRLARINISAASSRLDLVALGVRAL